MINKLWKKYSNKYNYAKDIDFKNIILVLKTTLNEVIFEGVLV